MMFSAQEMNIETREYTGRFETFEADNYEQAVQLVLGYRKAEGGRWRVGKRNHICGEVTVWAVYSERTLNKVTACSYELVRILDSLNGLPVRVYELVDQIDDQVTSEF